MGILKGKNALVTGTSQGIGFAIAKALIQAGCNGCLHYYSSAEGPEQLKKLADDAGQKAVALQADLTVEPDVVAFVQKAVDVFKSFDILVNNSGALVERRSLSQVDAAYWQKVLDINMTSMMLVTRELLPYFNKNDGTSIVNVSSLAGRKGGHPGSLVYSTAKGGVLTWTRSLARELGPQGIRVNAVAPGFIEGTRFHNTHTTRESALETVRDIPLGRPGRSEDIARVVAFLASEYDGFMTGATIDVNGGQYYA